MTNDSMAVCIPKNTLVQVYFKNSVIVEGVVVSWKQSYAILRAPGGVNNIVIYNPSENILMIKMVNTTPAAAPKTPPHQYAEIDEDDEEEMEPLPAPKQPKERVRTVAEERFAQVQQEKKQVASRLREPPRNVAPQLDRYHEPWRNK